MKKITIIAIPVLLAAAAAIFPGCRFPVGMRIVNLIDSVAVKWVPDKREGIFGITLYRKGRTLVVKGETTERGAKEDVINMLRKRNINFLDSLTVLPDPTLITKPWGVVSVSVCNIRAETSHSSELISQALMGTPVRILKIRGGWYFIQTPDKYLGWTEDDAVALKTQEEFSIWKSSPRIIFTGKYGDILSSDNKNLVISDIVAGCILEKTGEKNGFAAVTLPDGRTGAVDVTLCRSFTEWASEAAPLPERVCHTAEQLTGIPYLWGGASIKAMDCSGFVKTVYFLNGLILARDVSLQIRHGLFTPSPLPPDSLASGDLLYFGTVRNGKTRATHVAIYTGSSEYIHSSGMVRVNSLDSTKAGFSRYRYSTFLGRGRVAGRYPAEGLQPVAGHQWYF